MPDALAKLAIQDAGDGHPRRFAVTVVALTALLCAGVVGSVVAIDPRAEYGSPLGFQPLVVPDPGASKLALYEALSAPPRAVILGSSRAMALPPSVLGPDAFNFAVAGGGAVDTTIVYAHVVRTNPALSTVVVTVDVFGVTEGKQVRLRSSTAYDELTGQPAPEPGFAWGSLPSALSADVVQEALRVGYYAATAYPEPLETFDPDGLQHRPPADRAMAAGTYDLAAIIREQYAPDQLAVYAGERAPADEDVLRELGAMAADAVQRGLDVTIVLPPYEPRAYALVDARPVFHDRVASILEALLPLCGSGLHVVDYSDGSLLGLDPHGYYDGHHPTPANGAILVAAAAAHQGDLCGGA